jgi:hypothetical protein
MAANYVLLERVTTTSSVATITIDNIPQTGYTDLKLVVSARGDAGSLPDVMLRFNGDTGSNYIARELVGNGASAGTNGYTTSDAHVQTNGNTTTAATFSNAEIYIPNYRVAGVQKSFLGDAVNENNTASTLVQSRLVMWRWTGTDAINTINILTNGGNYVANTTFSLYGIAALGTTPAILPKATGGDIVISDGTYWYHTFISSGIFTPSQTLSCDVLQVAGGGGGARSGGSNYYNSGGGGAGGIRYLTAQSLLASSLTVTVGAGGRGGADSPTQSFEATNGNNSQLGALTASVGGGAGGVGDLGAGSSGGSGGGGSYNGAGGSATSGQGTAGGAGVSQSAGGGGGAGSAGGTGGTSKGGAATNTYSSILSVVGLGVSGSIAGGGGGGYNTTVNTPSGGNAGGGGGAGNGGVSNTSNPFSTDGTAATSALAFTGSGGGGAPGTFNYPGGGQNGGSGGSGFIIVRYTVA